MKTGDGHCKRPWCWDGIYIKQCRGVTTPTPFVDFSERSLYRARIAFLWGAMAISKNEFSSAISAPIGVKFCKRLYTLSQGVAHWQH